jgi:dihydropteroate synthase
VVPVIHAIRTASGALARVPISIDTTRAEVAQAALGAGADAINDCSAGEESEDDTLRLAGKTGAGVILMHRLVPPGFDRYSDAYERPPQYADVTADVVLHLTERAARAHECGVEPARIALDPGLGFGKSVEHNMELIARSGEIAAIGFPVVSGLSRKSFVGRASLGRDSVPGERIAGTIALSVAHLYAGARLFRVHDDAL